MGKRGPQPKPTALRVLDGTHRADRHGDPDREPGNPIDAIPEPPGFLKAEGIAAWNEMLGAVLSARYVTEFDLRAFATYCRTFDDVTAIDDAMEGQSQATPDGRAHPLIAVRFKWLELRKKYEDAFWFTPTARAGKQAAPVKKDTGAVQARRRG